MLDPYIQLSRAQNPIGFWLLWWPTAWALWLTTHGQQYHLWVIFLVGTWIMRSAGCVINDWMDCDIDPLVNRTQHRPLATQSLSTHQALYFFIGLLTVAFILCLQLPIQAQKLCYVAVGLVVLYPTSKRWLQCPQIILGLTFAMSIPITFAATNMLHAIHLWLPLYGAAIMWPLAYDTLYAMSDIEDDQRVGIYSSPLWFKQYTIHVVFVAETITFFCLMIVGLNSHANWPFWTALVLAMTLLLVALCRLLPHKAYQSLFRLHHHIGLLILLGFIFAL